MSLKDLDLDYALKKAVREGDLQKVKELISVGANVHTCKDEDEYWSSGLRQNERETLLNGVSVNYSHFEELPLNTACSIGSTAMVKVLLKAGACVNARRARGCTPLTRAVQSPQKNLEMIKVLLEYGADINVACQQRYYLRVSESVYTSLDYAILGDLSVAKLLIKMYLLKTCNFKKRINLEPYWGQFLSNYNIVIQYFDDCVNEIEQMKTEMMNQQISLYDIVSKDGIQLPGNSEWAKSIEDIMIERYPVYHDIIADTIETCRRRWRLLNKLKELFCLKEVETPLEKQIVGLDPNSVEIIANYLTTEDLSNLVAALSNSVESNDNCSSKSEEI